MRPRPPRRLSPRWTCLAWDEKSSDRARGAEAAAWEPALALLHGMLEASVANLISFNSTITACARARHWQAGAATPPPRRQVSLALWQAVAQPTGATLGAAVAACERGAHWPGALQLLTEAWEKGPEPNVLVLSAAMNAMGQGLRWDLSLQLIQEAEQRAMALDAARLEPFRGDFPWVGQV